MLLKIKEMLSSWCILFIGLVLGTITTWTFTWNDYTWSGNFQVLGLTLLIVSFVINSYDLYKSIKLKKETV